MGKRRRPPKSAEAHRGGQAVLRTDETSPSGGPSLWGRRAIAAGLALLSAAMLHFAFAPYDLWPAAYVALVPWVLALRIAPSRRWGLLIGWTSGLAFWLANLYWLTWITLVGYFAASLYLSTYWLAAAAILGAVVRRRWPTWACLPVAWVGLEYAKVLLPPSALGLEFSWFDLALTQYAQTRLIQVADLTGQYGVSFFVALINGVAADGALGWWAGRAGQAEPPLRRRLAWGLCAAALAAAVLLGYGSWQLSRDAQTEGPVLGVVQRAYPISLSGQEARQEEILRSHLEGMTELAGSAPDLVIWPETMLPRGLNRQVLEVDVAALAGDDLRALAAQFFGPDAWKAGLDDPWIRQHLGPWIHGGKMPDGKEEPGRRGLVAKVLAAAGGAGCPILAGGASLHPNPAPLGREDRWVVRNSAIWFDPHGGNSPIYSKRQLVPFSEYVPFKHGWPALHRLLRRCVPASMEQLDPGPAWTVFELKRPAGAWRLVSPICYEGTFASVCRRMVYEGGRKRADILANLSNDGWFVYQWGEAYRPSAEHAQHLSHYCFRAVENRVPVVRAVNTGISASIDSNGRILAEVHRDGRSAMISGVLALDGAGGGGVEYRPGHGPKVLVDRRISWYSRVGDAFAMAVALAAAAISVRLGWPRRDQVRKGGKC